MTPKVVRESLKNDFKSEIARFTASQANEVNRGIIIMMIGFKIVLEGVAFRIVYKPNLNELWLSRNGFREIVLRNVKLVKGIPVVSNLKWLQKRLDEIVTSDVMTG